MTTKSVDDLLVRVENNKLGIEQSPLPVEQVAEPETVEQLHDVSQEVQDNVLHETSESEPDAVVDEVEPETETDNKPVTNEPIDEYGNPVAKSKTYTEEEVQRMIRERLARGRHNEQQVPQQPQQKIDNFESDPNSDESWDVQLKRFVKQTMEETKREESEHQWRQQETQRQAEFESKFTTGMQKYSDFHQVVAGKPITDTMMMAARHLDNPAAFIYGASKLHAQELDRIARIDDPYVQAAEVGRLHEKMVKARAAVSNTPKPIEVPKGALPHKTMNKLSLEDRINLYAKQKRK